MSVYERLRLSTSLCLVKTKSTFEINNLKKRDVTMLHAIWLGEITIRQRHPAKDDVRAARSMTDAYLYAMTALDPRLEVITPALRGADETMKSAHRKM